MSNTTRAAAPAGHRRRPNILFLMADQLAPQVLPAYGHPVVQAPNLSRLAAKGVVFDSAYCNFPICAPSRFSMLSGRLPHSIGAYDNASEFAAATPTVAHYLRHAGYRTILCGKMHFIGPDQLHGYEERLTTDIYPADFAWTPDWLKGPAYRPTGVSMRPVLEAGPCVRSLQIDYDDEVEYRGCQKLYDLARAPDTDAPFFLTVSFTHPHPPFVSTQRHWDLYRDEDIAPPRVPLINFDELDEHSRWLHVAHAQDLYSVSPAQVQRARRAYYGMVSYVDEKIGRVLQVLQETGLADNTVVVFAGDHGEMLGERGMWFKQCFFEWSVRVPLIVSCPARYAPRRVAAHVSLLDLLPTLLDVAAEGQPQGPVQAVTALDGQSLLPLITGQADGAERQVVAEYSSEGVCAASRMVRRGRWKYIFTHQLPPMLFDLQTDPDELHNLAGLAPYADEQARLHAQAIKAWDPDEVHTRILDSQRQRLFLNQVATQAPALPNWAYQPFVDESQRFIRGAGGAGPTSVKARARFPFVEAVQPDLDPTSPPG